MGHAPVAIVVGGGRNLGAAVCGVLAAQGNDLVVVVRADLVAAGAVVAEARRSGVQALAVAADIAHSPAVERMVATALDRFGRIDAVVNCASIRPHSPTISMSDSEWDEVIAVGLSGTFYVCRAVLPTMVEQRRGAIVNVSGIVAYNGGAGESAHIAAAKAGVLGLTRALAREFGPHGVRANAVVPSRIDGPKLRSLDPGRLAGEMAHVPMGRPSDATEVAEVCAFLTSDRASHVTGQAIHVNGGHLMV